MLFISSNNKDRIDLLKFLSSREDLPGSLFDRMSEALPEMNTYWELHLFISIVEKHGYVSQPILTQISRLLENEDFFLARKAFWYLETQTLSQQIKNRVQVFREESIKNNRPLH